MTISIIVPVYNVSNYVRECLDSVVAQSFQGTLECIIVDDCGTDDSMTIVDEYLQNYSGKVYFRIIHHDKNKGLSAARNTGINVANGEWLYFLDSDDWIEPNCIELLYSYTVKYPDVQLVQGGTNVKGGEMSWMDFTKKSLPEYSNNPQWISKSLLQRFTLNMTAWNKLIKKNFITDNKLSFAEGLIHEDEIFNVDLANTLSCIAICPFNTYDYRIRPNSIMSLNKGLYEIHSVLSIVWDTMFVRANRTIEKDVFCLIWSNFNENFFEKSRRISPWPLAKYLHSYYGWVCIAFLSYCVLYHIKGLRRFARYFSKYMAIINDSPVLR